jgi:hypothetical protein
VTFHTLLIAVLLAGQAGVARSVPPIESHRVGPVVIGASAQDVYEAFPADRRELVDLRHEGMLSPALLLRFPGTTQPDSIVAELAGDAHGFVVWRIAIRDPAFRTAKGIGVGSTVGQLRAAHQVGAVLHGEGNVAVRADDLSASFLLDQASAGGANLARFRDAAMIPDSVKIASVLLTGRELSGPMSRFSERDLTSATISMQRVGRCAENVSDPTDVRQCPTYSVAVAGDGTVTYQGDVGVKTLGTRTHTISINEVRRLLSEFLTADFFSLKDRYDSIPLPNGLIEVVNHGVATTLTLSIGGKTKQVYAFYGTPAVVSRLEGRVDEVADSRRYTGRPRK